ncbi:uncharacterized protein BDZ99DRAFT_518859 [Mytilinidion resinicola]|uniref:Uncharacterized protein n=1 Tax=Mytilinidion resinicola TaxID=574789 RepID=A0A6A6YSV6_9PEZI|nr:uncharacterized protein BDZ99DRAFT_518859 [Mytilinidion resinicola]KAF2811599.1 hypothetical protein BDZ99DRAFT_518859 [Mytilinidion resinicola]
MVPANVLEDESNTSSYYLHQWPHKSLLWQARWGNPPTTAALNPNMHIPVEPSTDGPRKPPISVISSTKNEKGNLTIIYKEEAPKTKVSTSNPTRELDRDQKAPAYINAFNQTKSTLSAFTTLWNDCGADAETFGYRADGRLQGGCYLLGSGSSFLISSMS